MEIVDSLQNRLAATGRLQRCELFRSTGAASRMATAALRVPPRYEFPLHAHPHSEDCFFVLSGSGEVFSANERFPISEVAGVWVPPGVSHGLASGARGVLEIGFQSPPGPTIEHDGSSALVEGQRGIVVASISRTPQLDESGLEWKPVFTGRTGRKHLDPRFCYLEASQQLHVFAHESEMQIVVVRGAIELGGAGTRVEAITALHLSQGESEVLNSLEDNTLLLNIQASAAKKAHEAG